MRLCVSRKSLFLAFLGVAFIKLILAIYTMKNGVWSFGEGNDADYYHNYALGNVEKLANYWNRLLKLMNDYGWYSRDGVKVLLMMLGFVVIPVMVAELSVGDRMSEPKTYCFIALLVSGYPTLCYYALDIYRDVFLCFLFLMSVFMVKRFFLSSDARARLMLMILIACMSYVMFLFRPYLGAAFAMAWLCSFAIYHARLPAGWCVIGYLIALNGIYALGGLDSILLYRSMFESTLKGGSNLGLVFGSVPSFTPFFLKSFSIQMLGFYFSNSLSWIFFLVESVPFMAGIMYLILNRRFADRLVGFLIIFSVVYGTVWLLGNDNMGTAIRLRLCNYLALIICVATVYLNKKAHALRGGI
jgi:hypothetical protein